MRVRVKVEGEGGGCRASPAWRGEGACQGGAWGLRLGALLAAAEGPSRASARGTWKSLGYKLPVLKLQATSCRLQATGCRLQATSCRLQAAGCKLQGTGDKLQATSYRLQAASYSLQATSDKLQATSHRLQATGHK